MNPAHLICGLAASLRHWRPEQLTRFVAWHDGGAEGETLPLRVDHQTIRALSHGVEPADVGTCLAFASIAPADGVPGGLLCLGELSGDYAPQIFADMSALGQWQAMSVGGVQVGGDLWPCEVSLTSRPADEAALVIATGPAAARTWELLTGQPVTTGGHLVTERDRHDSAALFYSSLPST